MISYYLFKGFLAEEGVIEGGHLPGWPVDFDFTDDFIFFQAKMGYWHVEEMESAAGLSRGTYAFLLWDRTGMDKTTDLPT